MQLQLVPVAHPCIARAAGTFQCPLVFPIVDDRRLFFTASRCNFRKNFQLLAHTDCFPEGTGILPAIMADDCTMELFFSAAAGSPLEVKHTVRTMCNRLQSRKLRNAGALLFGDRLPVGKAGAGFHQQEGPALHGVIQVVHQGRIQRRFFHCFAGLVPCGVVVPAGNVDLLGHFEIVDAVKPVHHVYRELCIRSKFFHGITLKFQKINVSVTDKALPVQRKALHGIFPLRGRAFDLFPSGIVVAPEPGVPRLVQGIQRAIPFLEPAAERGLTQLAMAVAAHLVGDMPEQDSRVIAEPLRQHLVDDADFFPVNRRCIAVILPPVVQLPDPVCPDSAHLGVFVCHPSGAGRTGRCKDRMDSIGIQVMDDVCQPIQLKYPLLRFQCGP